MPIAACWRWPCAAVRRPLPPCSLLRFELLDCWADQQQRQQHGWALLQPSELAGLVADAERGSCGGAGAKAASRVLLLPLCTEYDSAGEAAAAADGAAAGARGPSLKVEVSYEAQLCIMEAAEMAAALAPEAAPAVPAAQRAARGACGDGGSGASSDTSDGENSWRRANRGSHSAAQLQLPAPQPQPQQGLAPRAEVAPATPAEPSLPATLEVEILQASGLAAAVREAAAAAGAGSSLAGSLGRATVVGPHAFARLALFDESELRTGGPGRCHVVRMELAKCSPSSLPALPAADSAWQAQAPPLSTPFVPQSFCPAWHASHTYPLQLTSGMLGALASQVS